MSKPITASFRYFAWVRVAALAATFILLLSSCSKTEIQTSSAENNSPTEAVSSVEPAELFGDFDEEAAEEVMTSINELRTQEGLEPYLTDDNMMEWAKARAAEIVFLFGHTRVDGSSSITAYPGDSATKFESAVARGYKSPQDLMNALKSSDQQRGRMLNEEYTYFGAACLDHGGSKYWTVVYLLP